MKKIIVSAAVAALALTTTASALEDIKVNGQAKIWYETNDKGEGLFNKDKASGEAVFKLGMTGKQGDVGFGATVYDTSTMGLEGHVVSGVRTNTNNLVGSAVTGTTSVDGEDVTGSAANNDQMYVGEAYITAPVAGATLKLGKQELDTPLLYTERWNAAPNTYNGAVVIAPASDNLTVIAAYVGQTSSPGTWKTSGTPTSQINENGAYALAGLYKADGLAVNAWYYTLPGNASAFWVDASTKVAGIGVNAYVASIMPEASGVDATLGYALSAGTAVSGWKVSAAASMVGEDGVAALANIGTGGKKTKLPTAGVYTDGVYVAQMGSTAMKVKAAGKVGSTGVAVQVVNNTNSLAASAALETTEIDLILSQKLGDFNVKGIILNRSFADSATDTASGGNHVRLIVSTNF